MSYSFKRKLKILKNILNRMSKHIENCSKIDCYVEKEFIIIRKENKAHENRFATIKIPTGEIDTIIKLERAKLYQAENKKFDN